VLIGITVKLGHALKPRAGVLIGITVKLGHARPGKHAVKHALSLRAVAAKRTGAGGKKKPGGAASTKAPTKQVAKTPPTKPAPSLKTARVERATLIARRMPLVHYPVAAKLADWSTWPDGLVSRAARGARVEPGEFEQLRGGHVFFYAGPSCYFKGDAIRDAVLYFDPSAEDGQRGGASPFDSGALEGPMPKLRPWAQTSVAERWKLFEEHATTLVGWRVAFE